jgi:hypothetical protein
MSSLVFELARYDVYASLAERHRYTENANAIAASNAA